MSHRRAFTAFALWLCGCHEYVVARSDFDAVRKLSFHERRSRQLSVQRAWDGQDAIIEATRLGGHTRPAGDPEHLRVRAVPAVHPATITGAVLASVGLAFIAGGAPLFGRPPPPSRADFPTCFFLCDGNSLGGLLFAIGGVHFISGVVLLAVGLAK